MHIHMHMHMHMQMHMHMPSCDSRAELSIVELWLVFYGFLTNKQDQEIWVVPGLTDTSTGRKQGHTNGQTNKGCYRPVPAVCQKQTTKWMMTDNKNLRILKSHYRQ